MMEKVIEFSRLGSRIDGDLVREKSLNSLSQRLNPLFAQIEDWMMMMILPVSYSTQQDRVSVWLNNCSLSRY